MDIKAIVLAAGKGTRMKSQTPKVLHEILGKPLLGYVLDNIEPLVSETFVVVGHQAELVERYANKRRNTKAIYQYPQLGTGDAVSKVVPYLEDYNGLVLVLCGDTPLITTETLKKFILIHTENNTDLTVMSAVFDDPTGYGRMVCKGDTLLGIVEEKDATAKQKAIKEVNAGIYLFNWEKFKDAFGKLTTNNAQGEFYLTDIVQQAKTAVIYTLENNDEIFGINSREHLAQAAGMLNRRKLESLMDNGVTIVDPQTTWISEDTTIDEDTVIYPSTYITGKNIIGKNCKIGPFAHLRGGVEVADNVKIGNFVEVKNSRIGKDTNAAHLSYIGDSEIGSGVNVGAGTITANYNALTKEKSRTVIGNGVKIGSNSVLVAPVEIKNDANIGAGSVITKNIPERALAFTRAALKIVENWTK
jgi:bifunctional UDP-N-acetylglucosamine pyrophosphorylase/glucosamine-1-phosphate N-acetyltransferase